jgi:transposase-like protein
MSIKKYDEEFKRKAVRLVESGHTAARVARDLGLRANPVYLWRKHSALNYLSPHAFEAPFHQSSTTDPIKKSPAH